MYMVIVFTQPRLSTVDRGLTSHPRNMLLSHFTIAITVNYRNVHTLHLDNG
jgi:hypothetical protein